ncbi:two-component system response regulator YesN [Cohnella sp. SGD-V74]|uniref:response regulator n=1 Tax=unclassified Cohnella TaxID=2636738 RepID=UPI000D48630E|nr:MULTISPECIES: response regulator [unclassified Cohnella]PRX64042.1 two-component system response regulator YesN [Cohnella sp. SGD-V74]
MYKLIIVDDEYSTRNGLKICIHWFDYGIEVAGEAENGSKGLELADRVRPDIVLTDVKMPGMDGIEMVKRLKERHPDTKIVFISGYDDIEYLKSAMKMDAVDYILKPVNLQELTAVIDKIMAMSKREENRKDMLQRLSAKLNESIPLLREKFFIQLIKDGNMDRASTEKRIDFLDLRLPYQAPYCVIIIGIDNPRTVFEKMPEQNTQLISFAIQNICREVVEARASGSAFEHQRGEYVLIVELPENEGEEIIFPLVSELMASLNGFLNRMIGGISLTIGIGGTVEHLGRLADSYQMASGAIERKLFLGRNQVVTFDAMAARKDVDYRAVNERMTSLSSALKSGDAVQVSLRLDALFEELRESSGIGYIDCQRIGLQVLLVASQFLSESGIRAGDLGERESEAWAQLMKLETLDDMSHHLKVYLTQVCERIEHREDRRIPEVITEIMRIIQERYSENLTIADIASQVYLAKTYICLLFKQETGETINEYITRVRMEQAKKLLNGTDRKLAEICTAIGYAEPSYFTKQFRKYTGMNPSDYRDIHRRTDG